MSHAKPEDVPIFFPSFFFPSSFMRLTTRAKCPIFPRLVLLCSLRRVLKAPSVRPIFPLLYVAFHSPPSCLHLSFGSLSFLLTHFTRHLIPQSSFHLRGKEKFRILQSFNDMIALRTREVVGAMSGITKF